MEKSLREKHQGQQGLQDQLLNLGHPIMKIFLHQANFMRDAGIYEDFLLLVSRVGLTTYMNDESDQYTLLTESFVESCTFHNSAFRSYAAFRIYNRPITMPLSNFFGIIGIAMFGTAKKIKNRPTDLLELYREVTNDDDRIAQRGKIRNIQLPTVRYFSYYLATSILGRENTSNYIWLF
jgi:hypothetical protein